MLLAWYSHIESYYKKKRVYMLSNGFNKKMLVADIFEVKKEIKSTSNTVQKLWQDAKDIEITLDFMEPNGFVGKIIKKFAHH